MPVVPDRHLDLGCGAIPRNPYQRGQAFGVDLAPGASAGVELRAANLSLDPIPFPDRYFGSVSAFDFLEHVPRILPTRDGLATRFPFVELMQEIWRVLDDRGRLYALTPAWPSAEAFVDPTHVNILTAASHRYFCGDAPAARMYGFAGRFEPLRIERVERNEALSASADSGPAGKRVTRRLRRWSRWLRGRGERVPAYLLWELEARR